MNTRATATLVLSTLVATAACATGARSPATAGGAADGQDALTTGDDRLIPPGFGSLRQDEISMTLRTGALHVRVTPLEEWILRLTAPDTWERLSSLAATHRRAARAATGDPDPTLMLVSVFTEAQGVAFAPEDIQLENRGRQERPVRIRPVTPGWGSQRLRQRQAETAVYVFSGDVDLDLDLVVEYAGERNHDWRTILRRLERELPRARARAGGGAPQPSPVSSGSSSYFRSFR